MIDKGLLEDLELITTGQDPENSRNPNDSSVVNEREEQIFEGLEILFGGIEVKVELDKARDMLTENGMKTEVILDIEVLPPGEGVSMIDYKGKEQLTNRTIPAEIKMIIEKNIKGEVAVTRGFLNNVPRRFTFDSCANSSFIINTKNSERDRRFRIIKPSKKCMEAESEFTGTYYSEDEDDDDSNRDQNAQIIQNIEDIKELSIPGMEIRISVRDILEGLKQCEDVLNDDNDSAMVTFMMRIEDPGT